MTNAYDSLTRPSSLTYKTDDDHNDVKAAYGYVDWSTDADRPTRVDCTDGNWLQYGYNTVDQSTFLRYHFGGVTRTTSYTLSADCLSFLIKSGRPIWSDRHEKRLAAKDCQP